METINASDAKREFGEMLLKAQHAPVGINKNGKPVAVVLSSVEYEAMLAVKQELLQRKIDQGVADIQTGRVEDGSVVMAKLRELAADAEL